MKTFLSILFFGVFAFSVTSAQSNSGDAPFSVGTLPAPAQQVGQANYLISLSPQDFAHQKYAFYTDSSAHVAYININGNPLRLTGGYNGEHILAYSGYGYTVTINNVRPRDGNAASGNITATMVIYNMMGKAVVKDVMGTQIK